MVLYYSQYQCHIKSVNNNVVYIVTQGNWNCFFILFFNFNSLTNGTMKSDFIISLGSSDIAPLNKDIKENNAKDKLAEYLYLFEK